MKKIVLLSPVLALLTAASTAFAQTAPSVPTTAVQLAQSVDMSDAKSAGLIIVGLLIGVGIALWGARLVEAKFRPKV